MFERDRVTDENLDEKEAKRTRQRVWEKKKLGFGDRASQKGRKICDLRPHTGTESCVSTSLYLALTAGDRVAFKSLLFPLLKEAILSALFCCPKRRGRMQSRWGKKGARSSVGLSFSVFKAEGERKGRGR